MRLMPWERADLHPAAAERIAELVDREERDARPPCGVGSGFRLIWDFGTLHGLTEDQRTA